MPTPTKGKRLGGSPAHERMILANLATALFEHRRITTTEAKARRLRPFAERLITKARRGDLHARRQVMRVIRDKTVVHELFTEIGPMFASRPGGYTRITKVGPRKGDNAPMAVIELVTEEYTPSAKTSAEPAAAAAVDEQPADEPAAEPAADEAAAEDTTESADESTESAEATEPAESAEQAESAESGDAARADGTAESGESTETDENKG